MKMNKSKAKPVNETYSENAEMLLQIKRRKLDFEIQKFKFLNPDFVFTEEENLTEEIPIDISESEAEGRDDTNSRTAEYLDNSIEISD